MPGVKTAAASFPRDGDRPMRVVRSSRAPSLLSFFLHIPDHPEFLEHEQHGVHDIHLIPLVKSMMGIGGIRVMVVVPAFAEVEQGHNRVIARRARSARWTLGRMGTHRVTE